MLLNVVSHFRFIEHTELSPSVLEKVSILWGKNFSKLYLESGVAIKEMRLEGGCEACLDHSHLRRYRPVCVYAGVWVMLILSWERMWGFVQVHQARK